VIPCADPHAGYAAHRTEIDAAIARVLESGRYILGPEVAAFEHEFAGYIGVAHAIGVGSGTEALHLALRACGIGSGDEVITVAHTAVATVAAIELAGAIPVLVDIDPGTYTLDPVRFEAAIGPRTKAVIPVHLYGHPADLGPIVEIARRRGLRVIEDCAQAHGARYDGRVVGSFGDIAAFSFYPTKNVGAIGDGGLVATDDGDLAERARLLREYGWAERYVSRHPGWNSRLDELQAAILRVKLRHLDAENGARSGVAALYRRLLDGAELTLPVERDGARHAYHLFVARSPRRDALLAHLRSQGVQALVHYPVPVHLQPAYRGRLRGADALPETESAADQVISLPMYPQLAEPDVRRVADAVSTFAAPARAG
jgi:dTDP-4-amino-4,6-dideoxygalactose transaminase